MQKVHNKEKLLSRKPDHQSCINQRCNIPVDDAIIQKSWKVHFQQLLNVDTQNDGPHRVVSQQHRNIDDKIFIIKVLRHCKQNEKKIKHQA